MQSQNTAYSLKARVAIKAEVKQLQKIFENNKSRIRFLESENNQLKGDISRIKNQVFHRELLIVAIFGIDPKMLRTYLKIYPIPFLTAYFRGSTTTLDKCKKWEIEIEKVRNNKSQ